MNSAFARTFQTRETKDSPRHACSCVKLPDLQPSSPARFAFSLMNLSSVRVNNRDGSNQRAHKSAATLTGVSQSGGLMTLQMRRRKWEEAGKKTREGEDDTQTTDRRSHPDVKLIPGGTWICHIKGNVKQTNGFLMAINTHSYTHARHKNKLCGETHSIKNV